MVTSIDRGRLRGSNRCARLLAASSTIALVGCADVIGADFGSFGVRGTGERDASTDAATNATTGGTGGRTTTGSGGGSGSGGLASGGASAGGSGGALGSSGGLSGSGGSLGSGGSSSGGSGGGVSIDAGCPSGAARCSSMIPTLRQTCVAGAWVDDSAACSGSTPTCFSGACVACNPGATQCVSGTQPQLCVSGAWTNNGSVCSGSSPVCLNGSCVACSPGATQCVGGTQPQTCSAAGVWQNSGSPVTHDNGIGQTWQDCVPLDTYNESQAMKACVARTGDTGKCLLFASGCGSAPFVQGTDGTYSYFWVYVGTTAGYVGDHGCPNSAGQQWH
jgi:hypothetical protein